MLFYCSEHMQKRESNICELDTCSFLRFSLPTNTEPFRGQPFFFPSLARMRLNDCGVIQR